MKRPMHPAIVGILAAGILFAGILAAGAGAERLYQFELSRSESQILYRGVQVTEGTLPQPVPGASDAFALALLDFSRQELYRVSFGPPQYGLFTVAAPYLPSATVARITNAAGDVVLTIPIAQFAETCGNARCEPQESFETCARDCSSGSQDDYCDREPDERCDPDCKAAEDGDCATPVQKLAERPGAQHGGERDTFRGEELVVSSGGEAAGSGWWWLVPAGAVLVLAVAFFLRSRRTAQLTRYVESCRTQGYTDLSIREALGKGGYSRGKIERALRKVMRGRGKGEE